MLGLLGLGIAGVGPCAGVTAIGMMGGCAYTHTQEGTSVFRAQVAGIGEDEAALSADMTFDGYRFEFRGDPLALGKRVVQDIGDFVKFVGAQFKARP